MLVSTPKGDGKVIGHNVIKNLISVNLEEGAVIDIKIDQVQGNIERLNKKLWI